jgi:hypothetical protein
MKDIKSSEIRSSALKLVSFEGAFVSHQTNMERTDANRLYEDAQFTAHTERQPTNYSSQ